MSVFIGKMVWFLVSPANLFFSLLFAAVALSCWRRSRMIGIRLASAMLAVFAIVAILPVGDWALRPLEEYFPQPDLPDRIDGIIVLGGSENVIVGGYRGRTEVNENADRLIAFTAFARQYPEARLIYTGGGVHWGQAGIGEADMAGEILAQLGIDTARVQVDSSALNTAENAANAKEMANPRVGENWVLITSAAHMPRAVNCFLSAGFPVLPYPVDYRTGPPPVIGFKPSSNLLVLDGATREWLGLLAYRLLGHTQSFLPARQMPEAHDSRDLNVTAETLARPVTLG